MFTSYRLQFPQSSCVSHFKIVHDEYKSSGASWPDVEQMVYQIHRQNNAIFKPVSDEKPFIGKKSSGLCCDACWSCPCCRKLAKFVESPGFSSSSLQSSSLIPEVSRPASIQSLALVRMILTGMISLISTFLMPSFSVNAPREISFRLKFFWHAFRTNLLERSILERRGLGRILDRLSSVGRSKETRAFAHIFLMVIASHHR